jgi:hypothetical protein
LYYTGNYNADLAAAWIIENEDKDINGSFSKWCQTLLILILIQIQSTGWD